MTLPIEQDASTRAESEAEADQRHRLQAQLRDSPAGLASLAGPEHMVTATNKLFLQLFGGRPLAGLRLSEALPELHDQPFLALLDEAYRTGSIGYGHQEVAYCAAASAPVYFTFIAQPVRDAAGEVTGLLLFAYDVSAHVQARHLAEANGAQPAITDQQLALAHAQLATANEELATTNEELSVTNEELDAANNQLLAANQELAVANAHLRASNTDIRAHTQELHRTQRTLRQLNQQLEARVAKRTGQLQAALHETEQTNTALSQSNDSLMRTNEDLDSFVYAASHDLKLPVLNLTGLFGELLRGVTFTDPAEGQLLVPLIQENLRQLTATLDDLVALGQMQPATAAPAETVELADIVKDVLQVLEPQMRAARARVTTDFAARPAVSYPRANLRTILLNLLSNAFKYADPERPCRVHVSLWLDDNQPVLWVKDNGLGFDAVGHGPELFQLFRRFHHHTEGTGVGLYLVNRLVHVTGGRLEVESRVGEGATFRIYLGQPS